MNESFFSKKLYGIITLVFILYLLSIVLMRFSEGRITNLYEQHSALITKAANADEVEQKELLQEFGRTIKLSASQSILLSIGFYTQKAIDFIMPGVNHCLVSKQAPCGVYTPKLLNSAQGRFEKLILLSKKEPFREPVIDGRVYTLNDFIVKMVGLFVITMAIYWVVIHLKPFVESIKRTDEND